MMLPDTPAGKRLGWLLDVLQRGGEGLTAEQVTEAFAPSMLAMLPAEQLVEHLKMLAARVGRAELTRVKEADGFVIAALDLPADGGVRLGGVRLMVFVEPTEPHRVVQAPVLPAPTGKAFAWADVRDLPEESVRRRSTLDAALAKELDDIVESTRDEHRLVGVGYGIVRDGELVHLNGVGWADPETRQPITEATDFRIGSVSKTLTSIGIVQLHERGLLDIDDPVDKHLTSYSITQPDDAVSTLTIKHLLTHTGGIVPRPVDIGVDEGEAVPSVASFYADGLAAAGDPGTNWAYSNDAFATLGQIIEDVSGQPFGQYMIDNVFDPLGMANTDYYRSERIGPVPRGFDIDIDELVEAPYRDVIIVGAGSVFSTVPDMGRYAHAVMNGGANDHGRVLTPESLELMLRPHHSLGDAMASTHMGLGFLVHDYDGHRVAWHNGGWPGASAQFFVAVDDGLAVVLFVNVFSMAVKSVVDNLGEQLMRRLLKGA